MRLLNPLRMTACFALGTARGFVLAVLVMVATAGPAPAMDSQDVFALVPEMEAPPGLIMARRLDRRALEDDAEAARGLEQLREHVLAVWPQIRRIDLAALSRYHVDITRGFRLPPSPGTWVGRPIHHETDNGRWHLELRGPRLPARFDIVHRYLYVYAIWDPATGDLDQVSVTIRGWVLE